MKGFPSLYLAQSVFMLIAFFFSVCLSYFSISVAMVKSHIEGTYRCKGLFGLLVPRDKSSITITAGNHGGGRHEFSHPKLQAHREQTRKDERLLNPKACP